MEQVRAQLPTSADNMALPTFATVCHAVVWLLPTTSRTASDQYLLLAGPKQQTYCSGVQWSNAGTCGQMEMPDHCIDPAPHITRAVPIIISGRRYCHCKSKKCKHKKLHNLWLQNGSL